MKLAPWVLGVVGLAASGAACSQKVVGADAGGVGSGASTGIGGGVASTMTGTPPGASTGTGGSPTRPPPTKIDLLLAVDNSAHMADKQAIFAQAMPELLGTLTNPPCLDDTTMKPTSTPAGPMDACPAGSTREFAPVLDIHVGLVSSSLGDFGVNISCPAVPAPGCPAGATNTPLDDHGHLLTRDDACGAMSTPTFQNEGFLAWNPQAGAPAGSISQLGSIGMGGLVGAASQIVIGTSQLGCGYESQDEAWYRFLADPKPYGSIAFVASQVSTSGIDQVLLTQRQEFLRPDSILAIVVLSDETDTSIQEFSSFPIFTMPQHLPHATSACRTSGPTDPCCASCEQPTPPGCTPDPACISNPSYSQADEDPALHAFGLIEHKTSYGIEFFYQPSRYIEALTSPTVTDANGATSPNPIFTNLNPAMYPGAVRDPSLVFYTAIVGVPWQLIARQNRMGQPDLVNGYSDLDVTQVGGFKTAAELSEMDRGGKHSYWDDIAGNPESYVKALSPFMQESSGPRVGIDPITGAAIAPIGTPNDHGAAVGVTSVDPTGRTALLNDHEWTIPMPPGDIQYACVFTLPTPRDEGPGSGVEGECSHGYVDNPVCSPNPNDGGRYTLQTKAKAYPGIKELAIARGLRSQGVVGSICPAQLADATQPDYGHRPSVRALIDALKARLKK